MNRVAFNIFGFNVYYYSLCILLGVIVAYILITREGKKQGLSKEFTSDLIFYTLIIGILGARVYYCVFNLDYYLANPSEILKIYNEMEIHDKTEIQIEPLEICEYLGITPGCALKQIIEEIENNILEKKLLNEKENIKKYLNKYKKCYNN